MNQNQILDTIKEKFKYAIEVKISDDVYNICLNFAEKVNTTTKYEDCGQFNMDKRKIDNLIGKIAEYSVYAVLDKIGKEHNFKMNLPDIEIYKGRKKSWRSDLVIDAEDGYVDIGVKAQSLSQAIKYSLSGTFQIASFRKDEVFKHPNEVIFLCMVDDMGGDYKRIMLLPPKKICEIIFADPKVPRFKGIKTCYYAKDNFEQKELKDWMETFGIKKFGSII